MLAIYSIKTLIGPLNYIVVVKILTILSINSIHSLGVVFDRNDYVHEFGVAKEWFFLLIMPTLTDCEFCTKVEYGTYTRIFGTN